MKRILSCLLLSVLLLGLCGCGDYVSLLPGTELAETAVSESAFEPTAVSELLGWDGFMSSYYDNTPVALSRQGAEGYFSPVFDRETIIKACDAVRGMTATEKLTESADAADTAETVFRFTMADGSTRDIRFAGETLRCVSGDYTVSGGEALWELPFPAYDEGFSIFDLYYSDAVTAFAESFESERPASVGRRTNGGATLSNADADMVREVFELLRDAVIESVEANPDQTVDLNTVQDYVFTMDDGSTQTFTFTGGCLTVKVSDAYGPVYYRISTGEQLRNLPIAAKTAEAVFEGGTLDELRTDIARAVAVANGEYVEPMNTEMANSQDSRDEDEDSEDGEEEPESTGMSVAGAYITFLLDGAEDYVSLQGEQAQEFVQLLGRMEVSAERAESEPTDSPVTVSVNLSDWSGPIIYFRDGWVQQSVGVWYRVNEDDYAAMKELMMDDYWEQVDSRTIEGTGDTEND